VAPLVYENRPNGYAMTHSGECSHCNWGEGTQPGAGDENGKRLGPFDTVEHATRAQPRSYVGAVWQAS